MTEQTPPPVPPAYSAPAAPGAPEPRYIVAGEYPGRTLGIVGLIVSFFFTFIGLILSIIAKVQSNRVGLKNTPATVGIVLGAVFTLVYIAGIIVAVVIGINVGMKCADLGPGSHLVGGVAYTCG